MKATLNDYQKRLAYIKERPLLRRLILFFNRSITRIMYLLYPTLLVSLFWTAQEAGENPWQVLSSFVLVPTVGFVLLSLIRKKLNAPRPYERWDVEPLIEKETAGNSMPSRHVFSATIISMCVLRVHLFAGLFLLGLSLLLALCRVLVGVHYRRDVLVGFLLGLLAGSLLFL